VSLTRNTIDAEIDALCAALPDTVAEIRTEHEL
jgi:hypothetical protein